MEKVEQTFNFNYDPFELLEPVIAAQIMNAHYTALLLKQQQGVEITPEIEKETSKEVWLQFGETTDLARNLKKAPY